MTNNAVLVPAEPPPQAATSDALHAHLVGIGGSGMQSLAQVLLAAGWHITGSDAAGVDSPSLRAAGARIWRGHAAEHVTPGVRLVVYSAAVDADNVERQEATRRQIPQVSYPRMLAYLMAGRTGLAVAGTHGKSTTAALTAAILVEAGLDPTVVYGATPIDGVSGGRWGAGHLVVVEACEYRSHFLQLAPRGAIVTRVEHDHFDCFPTAWHVRDAFRRFVEHVATDGVLVVNARCRTALEVACHAGCRVLTYGHDRAAQWRAERMSQVRGMSRFRIVANDAPVADVVLRIAGNHNVENALAAAALAAQFGANARSIARGLLGFRGLRRRLERVGWWYGLQWWDDYAHHPTEVAAALASLRQIAGQRRIWCVFQPHQVSRTERLLDELAESLHNADHVAVAQVFAARETPRTTDAQWSAELARRTARRGLPVAPSNELSEIANWLTAQAQPGDICLTLGAGDIRKVWDGFLHGIRTLRTAG